MAARPKVEITREQERRAWELRQQCWSQERIAEEIGVDQTTVCRMLARKEKELSEKWTDNIALPIKIRQIQWLEHIAEQAMEEWRRSKEAIEGSRVAVKSLAPVGEEGDKKPLPEPVGLYLNADGEETTEEERAAMMVALEASGAALSVVEHKITKDKRGRIADAALLNQARGAMKDIRDILGLDAPKKQELAGPNGGAISIITLRNVSMDDL